MARYGGEEFIALDTKRTVKELADIIEEILNSVYDLNIPSLAVERKRVTLSAGISSKSLNHTKDYIELINFADDALYKAKAQGKNRLKVYERPNKA